jgi:protein-S-isoprenylcysteine O-methyltransferase Ste14
MVGVAVRFVTIGFAQANTSGRNAKSGQIADSVNRKGMYSLCRHPLYLGNLIMYVAILLFTKSPLFALAGALGLFIYYERIFAAEEAFLSQKFGAN